MNILHIVPTYYPAVRYGGPIVSVHALCKAMVKEGHTVKVYTTNVDGDNVLDVPVLIDVNIDGVIVRYFPVSYFRRIYFSYSMLISLYKEISWCDIVHNHSVFLFPTLISSRLSILQKKPYILSPRGMLVKSLINSKSKIIKNLWLSLFEKKSIQFASGVHLTSKIELQEIIKFKYKIKNYIILPNGIDYDSNFSIKEIYSNNDKVNDLKFNNQIKNLLFIGRINWKKGLDRLIIAMKYISNTRLIIAGNDEEHYSSELIDIANKNNVLNKIEFINPVYGKDKFNLIKKCDLFILPSYSENFGNSVLEAMFVGVPVAITKDVGISSILLMNEVGILLPEDSESMGKLINKTITDSNKLKNMGIKGKYLAKNYSWDRISKEMVDYYAKIINDFEKV